MSARRDLLALAIAAVVTAAAAGARAQPISTSAASAEIQPLQGANAPLVGGWNEVVVRITNSGGKPERGQIEVGSHGPFGSLRAYLSTAPYVVAAGATIHVRVPAVVVQYTDVNVRVLDEAGLELTSRRFSAAPPSDNVYLLDVNEPSLLRAALHELPIAPTFTPALGRAHGSGPQLLLGSPRIDPATGDPVLPDRPTLFGGADAVLLRSDVLARLGETELEALSGYVLSGGTLAVAITRPEDLRSAPLEALAGGAVTQGPVSAATLRDLVLAMPSSGSSSSKVLPSARNAGDGTVLAGFGGGNLHASPYGSSATYGLGEVHLLAFDPTRKPAVDDPWAQVRVVDLARRAHDRRASIVFPPGGDDADRDVTRVRQILDPNESSQWGIAAAALLLCVYSVLAGPLNFSLAAKKGHPLRALRWLPIFSVVAFLMVVGVGMVAKGVTGRARHLTLIEAGAGMPRGTVRRWRGFFASSARDLTVHTSSASGVVRSALVSGGSDADGGDHLLVDRDGARLVDVAALPWQTVVIREDAVTSLGEGVTIVKDGAETVIKSRAGADLRSVVLKLPGAPTPLYFPRIKDGERVLASTGRPLDATLDERAWTTALTSAASASHGTGSLTLHPLEPHALPRCFDKDADGIRAALIALSAAAGDAVDWFPEDVPVLLGQLDGGEGHTRDGGLRLESDRVLVRVVGWGGRP